jgi:hypothetical protein
VLSLTLLVRQLLLIEQREKLYLARHNF